MILLILLILSLFARHPICLIFSNLLLQSIKVSKVSFQKSECIDHIWAIKTLVVRYMFLNGSLTIIDPDTTSNTFNNLTV